MKDATWNALMSPSSPDAFIPFWGTVGQNATVRFQLHQAAQWLGLESKTECGNEEYVTVRRSKWQNNNEPIFETRMHFENASNAKKQKKLPKSQKSELHRINGPSVSCEECGASSRTTDILVSVYHDGCYCDNCLDAGACETDPDYASKWKLWE